MNSETGWKGFVAGAILVAALATGGFGCSEALPVYVEPSNVMSVGVVAVEQLDDHLAPPGHQAVRIILQAENTYDEPFLDSVRIEGTMRISWERQPYRYKTVTLTAAQLTDHSLISDGKMLLIPGQAFSMEYLWNMRSDDGIYLPSLMNFAWLTRRVCAPNVACADPETFLVETSLKVYDRLGIVHALPAKFTFVARIHIQ